LFSWFTLATCFGQSSTIITPSNKLKGETRIDSLNSEKEVEEFIRSLDDRYKKVKVIKAGDFKYSHSTFRDSLYKTIADSLEINSSYYKADFDNNGYTDLFVTNTFNGFSVFIITNYGNNNYKTNIIFRRTFHKIIFPKIVYSNGIPLIECHWVKEQEWSKYNFNKYELEKELLVYKFESVIEYNENPSNYEIENIFFYTSKCYGPCPSFELEIDSSREAYFNAISDNRIKRGESELRGEYFTTIDSIHYNKLIEILNYLSFEKLKHSYSVNWFDDQDCLLEIVYGEGKIKRIDDYGLIGTYGLRKVYRLLFDLRFNQNWNK
ncbi:MAG: DUF6438 domain-containing protein, partial [Bacteroidota bacterium]